MKIRNVLLLGVLLATIITFSMKNAENVTVRYFGVIDAFQIPLFLLILLSAFLGIFVGTMVDLVKRYQLRKAIEREEKAMDELRQQVRSLRDQRLTGSTDEKGQEC